MLAEMSDLLACGNRRVAGRSDVCVCFFFFFWLLSYPRHTPMPSRPGLGMTGNLSLGRRWKEVEKATSCGCCAGRVMLTPVIQ